MLDVDNSCFVLNDEVPPVIKAPENSVRAATVSFVLFDQPYMCDLLYELDKNANSK